MIVTVTIKRGDKDTGRTYQLKETGESKKGTYQTFSPVGDNADLPSFGKLYIKAKREAEKKGKKSQ